MCGGNERKKRKERRVGVRDGRMKTLDIHSCKQFGNLQEVSYPGQHEKKEIQKKAGRAKRVACPGVHH